MTAATDLKPLGQKAYGHIPHLPGSRMGPGDHSCHVGQSRIAQHAKRDKHDVVYVQEKLDGSCVSVARVDGELIPLGRAGYRAITSKYHQHVLFDGWVRANYELFEFLEEGERVIGEWLAQAHGTRYDLTGRDPFVAFDLMVGSKRLAYTQFTERVSGLNTPPLLFYGSPVTIEEVLPTIATSGYGALDEVEGAVWRVERRGEVDFLAKYVRPHKIDGSYLPELSGGEPIWNWQPDVR